MNQLTCAKWGFMVIQREPNEIMICKEHKAGNSIIRNAWKTILYPDAAVDEKNWPKEKKERYFP